MKDRRIEELTLPPDFEVRAEAYMEWAGSVRYEEGLLLAENRTNTMQGILRGGIIFLGAEDYPNLNSANNELLQGLDIDSATENEVEILLSGGSQEHLEEEIETVDQFASGFGGKRISEPDVYQQDSDVGGDLCANLSYFFT